LLLFDSVEVIFITLYIEGSVWEVSCGKPLLRY
jgi:hypothetical protein